ncbi:hypothetical protein SKAU_G00062800 [Synaphobranchus kaupii]|uniref:Uncharacterized protein n=1 Tax=Synaphobranchus kaupii TaxID=118154 RepID=A0A9Q1G5C8_SYNKA|nr:hypothetical protein SKAU_G00062800 [Synaphobranchus kaupii]
MKLGAKSNLSRSSTQNRKEVFIFRSLCLLDNRHRYLFPKLALRASLNQLRDVRGLAVQRGENERVRRGWRRGSNFLQLRIARYKFLLWSIASKKTA